MTDHPTARTDWAGPDVRVIVDADVHVEFAIPYADAERLIESLRRSITGARRFVESQRAEVTTADAVQAVRRIHRPRTAPPSQGECICCGTHYPCPTALAVGEP